MFMHGVTSVNSLITGLRSEAADKCVTTSHYSTRPFTDVPVVKTSGDNVYGLLEHPCTFILEAFVSSTSETPYTVVAMTCPVTGIQPPEVAGPTNGMRGYKNYEWFYNVLSGNRTTHITGVRVVKLGLVTHGFMRNIDRQILVSVNNHTESFCFSEITTPLISGLRQYHGITDDYGCSGQSAFNCSYINKVTIASGGQSLVLWLATSTSQTGVDYVRRGRWEGIAMQGFKMFPGSRSQTTSQRLVGVYIESAMPNAATRVWTVLLRAEESSATQANITLTLTATSNVCGTQVFNRTISTDDGSGNLTQIPLTITCEWVK